MQDLANVFKALSDTTRLRVLKLLERGELCVCDIVAAMQMSQPKVSFHLNALKEAGFVKDRKEGRWIHYRLDEADLFRRFLILSVLEKLSGDAVMEDRLRLDAFLNDKGSKMICVTGKRSAAGGRKC
ncbi:MAG: metalloregulator ArsR/SmtB family transcription factor [Nitrospirota bacterium]|nr:metalloregulator ArsR/SmtB family transcription factor [Nitrospirota bacterium]